MMASWRGIFFHFRIAGVVMSHLHYETRQDAVSSPRLEASADQAYFSLYPDFPSSPFPFPFLGLQLGHGPATLFSLIR